MGISGGAAGGAVVWKPNIVQLSDENVEKLCSALSQMIVDEVDTKETWLRIQKKVTEFLQENCKCGGLPKSSVTLEAANILNHMEWSVKVKMQKKVGSCEAPAPRM